MECSLFLMATCRRSTLLLACFTLLCYTVVTAHPGRKGGNSGRDSAGSKSDYNRKIASGSDSFPVIPVKIGILFGFLALAGVLTLVVCCWKRCQKNNAKTTLRKIAKNNSCNQDFENLNQNEAFIPAASTNTSDRIYCPPTHSTPESMPFECPPTYSTSFNKPLHFPPVYSTSVTSPL